MEATLTQDLAAVAATETTATGIPKGAQTQDYYRTKNIPARFDNPGSCYLPGNPVFSCKQTLTTPQPEPVQDEWFEGYAQKTQHPMYRTSANTYGGQQPTVHAMPTQFHGRCQNFSQALGKCGMYRNHSLNTEKDKSKV